jgi:nucleoside 2-deoxyribosyltransferase
MLVIWNTLGEQDSNQDYVVAYSKHGNGEVLRLSREYYEKEISNEILKIDFLINGLLWNKLWPKETEVNCDEDILKVLKEFNIPNSRMEKVDSLIEFIYNKQDVDGGEVNLNYIYESEHILNSIYFKKEEELNFYLKTLVNKGFIDAKLSSANKLGQYIYKAILTFEGLEYYDKISNEGIKSKRCFVAMNFDDNMKNTRQAIKAACRNTGFEPILIDEIHYNSEITINDAIIAELKKSKFCISDFTGQKNGVYFESGFALGRGLKVIYSVHKDDLINSHFDTKHFPHITYETTQELEQKLINKIEAWIKD